MELINRARNWTVYLWSLFLGGVGMMTQRLADRHRRTDGRRGSRTRRGCIAAVCRIHETNNVLLNELIDAIRDDTENRAGREGTDPHYQEALREKGIIACSSPQSSRWQPRSGRERCRTSPGSN